MFPTAYLPTKQAPAQADWPALRDDLLLTLSRLETRWLSRGADAAEAVLSEVWFAQSALETATGPLEAWRALDAMCAAQGRLTGPVRDVMARLSEGLYGPVVVDVEDERARA